MVEIHVENSTDFLLQQYVQHLDFLKEVMEKKIPSHNWAALKARKFVLLGLMAEMSMVDGGPGLPVFAAPVFHYIATDSIAAGRVEDVPDPVVHHRLSLVSKCTFGHSGNFVS